VESAHLFDRPGVMPLLRSKNATSGPVSTIAHGVTTKPLYVLRVAGQIVIPESTMLHHPLPKRTGSSAPGRVIGSLYAEDDKTFLSPLAKILRSSLACASAGHVGAVRQVARQCFMVNSFAVTVKCAQVSVA